MSKFIQVGLTAMRDPLTGEMLDTVDLYVESSPETDQKLPQVDIKAFRAEMIAKYREIEQERRKPRKERSA